MSQLDFFWGLLVKCVTLLDVNWEPVFCICTLYHSLFFHWIEPFQVSSPQRPNFQWVARANSSHCVFCSGVFVVIRGVWNSISSGLWGLVGSQYFPRSYPKHLPEVKTCLADGSQEVPEEDLDTTLPQPGHGFRGSVKTWRGWMRNVRNREHAGKAIAVLFLFQHIS